MNPEPAARPEKILDLGLDEVKRFLPHRYPFLYVDRVVEIAPTSAINDLAVTKDKVGTRIHTQRLIPGTEPFFQGHFPNFPIMPGVIQLEAMAQTACFCFYPYVRHQLEAWTKEFVCVFAGLNGVRFRSPVYPGETIDVRAEVTLARSRLWGARCEVSSSGRKVAEAEIMVQITRYEELRNSKNA